MRERFERYGVKAWMGRIPFLAGAILFIACLLAPLVVNDDPIFCVLDGRPYFPAVMETLGLPPGGPFSRAGADGREILGKANASIVIWPIVRQSPTKPGDELLSPPSSEHLLGTDGAGRDVFARLIHGARVSLLVAAFSGLVSLGIAMALGIAAGYAGGILDQVISRGAEVFAAFPSFFLVLAVMAWRGPDAMMLVLLLGVTRWPGLFRYVRAEFMRLKQREFVIAARLLGAGHLRIIFSEILPNAWGAVLVPLVFLVSGSVILEAGLSWIGLGVPAETPSWGHMLREAYDSLFTAPHLLLPPALSLFIMVLLLNAMGESLRRKLDVQRL